MSKYFVGAFRKWVAPSIRTAIGDKVTWLREWGRRACFWKWGIARFSLSKDSPYEIIYLGRKSHRDSAMALLSAHRDDNISQKVSYGSDRRVIVSEIPFPGALRVSALLNSVVPLDRTIEEITSNFHSQLRRNLQKNRTRYHLQQVLGVATIEQVDREMLRPYASARHGISADQTELNEVKRMALTYGRLDLLLCGDEVVGCQLGHVTTRAGKRYWSTNRCGYPETIFSDSKKLRNTNAINIHLAMEWAKANGFDYYDIGVSLGRPGDGLLEWKRRRGGELDTMGNAGYFYVQLPKLGVAQFLWESPLFAVERRKITLHLGLPEWPSEEEVMSRYREMGFGGLHKVYLYSARPPAEHVIKMLHGFYSHQKSPPVFKIIPST